MKHLDEETIQRALHGELDPAVEPAVREHLTTCVECAHRLTAAEREERRVHGLLESLDHEIPAVEAEAIVEKASRRERWRPRRLAAVAITLLIVAGGLAYALPGSPFRAWIHSALSGDPPREGTTAPSSSIGSSGVSLEPGDSLNVVFESPQETGTVHVSLTPSREVHVRVLGDGPGFRVGPDRLRIANAGSSASYRIEIPGSAPRVRVLVGARTILEKEGSVVRAAVQPDSTGSWTITLSPRPRGE